MLSDDQLRGRTVIVLEDDPLTLELIVDLIEFHGGVALQATSAQEAKEHAAQQPGVSLLIGDIMLGGEAEGLAAAHEIAAMIPSCGILLVSGVSTGGSLIGDRDDRFHFLQKPFGISDFSHALSKVLDEH